MTRHRAALLVILLAAFFLRVWQLPYLPPGLWYDEAYNGMDARWMVETGQYPPFLVGNNGREALVHYLLLSSTAVLGQTPLAARAVGALAGFLTIPIIYRFALGLLDSFAPNNRQRRWLALAAAAWLAVSWWHLLLSRLGLRPVLLPPLLMLSLYFFWRGIASSKVTETTGSDGVRKRSFWTVGGYFVLAGFFLGLSQYTYLSARLAPVIFAGFVALVIAQIFINKKSKKAEKFGAIRHLWLGLLLTALIAALVFLPLGLFFLNHPDAFSSRTGDVLFAPRTAGALAGHLLQALSLFWGAGHELYRHHLPGRAMLGWLEIPFFWVGLVWLLRRLRRPETQLILLGLGVMWLPALLASPPVHALRPVGMLPFYYLIVTLGLNKVSRITYQVSRITHHASRFTCGIRGMQYILPLALAVFIPLNGLLNAYDYFDRWANYPEVYKEFNGPLVDLTRRLLDLSQTEDILLPLHLYLHPTTRYLLGLTFPERPGPPPVTARPVEMVIIPDLFQLLYVGNIPASPAMVRLTRDAAGQGAAYISRLPRADEQAAINTELAARQAQLKPFRDKLGRVIAQFLPLSPLSVSRTFSSLFDPTPLRVVNVTWPNSAALTGYDVTPNLAQPGQPITLNFYWRSLTNKAFDYRLFLQLINAAGQPVNQWEGDAFREDMYRWRPNGLLPTQRALWLGPDTPPGPYLVRLGFFDEVSGQRLPLRLSDNAAPADQIQLGLFYVTNDNSDPRQPATPLSATFANSIQLIGVTLPSLLTPHSSLLPVTLHWQTLAPTAKPYTVFLQLLNEQSQVVSGWDRQPFDGLYPTNLWSPGEVVAATFPLPLPADGLPPGLYRLITGFYDGDTGQRLMVVGGEDFVQVSEFEVK